METSIPHRDSDASYVTAASYASQPASMQEIDRRQSAQVAPLRLRKTSSQKSARTALKSRTPSLKDRSTLSSRAGARSDQQITPPLTPSHSAEDLTPHAVPMQPQFHNYLRAFYPYHPPCDEQTSTVTLPLNQGDVILIHSIHINGWADGTLLDSGVRGWLPSNYCEPYDPGCVRTLMQALTQYYDAVRGCSDGDGDISLLGDQTSIRGLVAGVRTLLEQTGCLTRESPLVNQNGGNPSLRRIRKAILAELSTLKKLVKYLGEALDAAHPNQTINDVSLDQLVLQAFRTVLRAVKFFDLWVEETERDMVYEEVEVENANYIPPTPPADAVCFADPFASARNHGGFDFSGQEAETCNQTDGYGNALTRREPEANSSVAQRISQRTSLVSPTSHRRSRPTSIQSVQTFSHRTSWSIKPTGVQLDKLASRKLIALYETLLEYLGTFVHLHLSSKTRNEILIASKGSINCGKEMLSVITAVCDRAQDPALDKSRENMYSSLFDFTSVATKMLQSTSSHDDDDVSHHEHIQMLSGTATNCVRKAGDVVAKTRHTLEVIGDFEFETGPASPFCGVDFSNSQSFSGESIDESTPQPLPEHQQYDEEDTVMVDRYSTQLSPVEPHIVPERHSSMAQTLPKIDTMIVVSENVVSPDVLTPPSSRLSSSSLLPPLLPSQTTPITPFGDYSPMSLTSNSSSDNLQGQCTRVESAGYSSINSGTTLVERNRDSDRTSSVSSTRVNTPEQRSVKNAAFSINSSFTSRQTTLDEVSEEGEDVVLEKTFAHELMLKEDGQVIGGSLPSLVERLTTPDSTPDPLFVTTMWLTFRIFATPEAFAQALIDRFDHVSELQSSAGPVRLRVYNVFKQWIETHWKVDADYVAVPLIKDFAENKLSKSLPNPGQRLIQLVRKVSDSNAPSLLPRVASSMGRTNTSIAQYIAPDTPTPTPVMSKSQTNLLKAWKNGGNRPTITDFDPLEIARQLTLKISSVFCNILPEELLGCEWTKKTGSIATNVRLMSTLSTDLAHLVADTILQLEDHNKRAKTIKQWTKVAARCLDLNNFDSLMAIVCSLNSTTILRLKRTWECVSAKTKATLAQLNEVVDVSKNYSMLRGRLSGATPPCLPFVGIYLTDLTFVDAGNQATRVLRGSSPQDPVSVINFDKHVKTARIISELQRFQIAYRLQEVTDIQSWIQDQFVRVRAEENGECSVNQLYRRSCILEPREQAAAKANGGSSIPVPTISSSAASTASGSTDGHSTKTHKDKVDFLGMFKSSN